VGRVGDGGVVDPDFLDLLGDIGDGNGVGFGALEGHPDGYEEEDEDDGGADTHAKHHPETEAKDGGGVGELVVHRAAARLIGHCCSFIHSFQQRRQKKRVKKRRIRRRRRRRKEKGEEWRQWQLAWWDPKKTQDDGCNQLQCCHCMCSVVLCCVCVWCVGTTLFIRRMLRVCSVCLSGTVMLSEVDFILLFAAFSTL